MNDEPRYTEAFGQYLRRGMEGGVDSILAEGADPDGGYLVPPSMENRIIQGVLDGSPLRRLTSMETLTTDALVLLDGDVTGPWSPENISATATAHIATKRSVPTYELYAKPKATQKLVDDANLDIEAWVASKVADIFCAERE